MQIRFIRLIDEHFAGLPQSGEILELKEEMVQNLMEKFGDLLAEGKSEQAAFDIAAASVGDVDELIAQLYPRAPEPRDPFRDSDEEEDIQEAGQGFSWHQAFGFDAGDTVATIRHKTACLTALGVMLYILCPVPVILLTNALGVMLLLSMVAAGTGLFIYMGMSMPKKREMPEFGIDGGYATLSKEVHKRQTAMITTASVMLYILCATPIILFRNTFGVSLLFVMVAAATGMLIYDSMARPKKREMTDESMPTDRESYEAYASSRGKKKHKKATKSLSSAISSITLVLYFVISFRTGAWHITWVIFLLGAAVNNIIKALFELKEGGRAG